jgi:hypothetical protein
MMAGYIKDIRYNTHVVSVHRGGKNFNTNNNNNSLVIIITAQCNNNNNNNNDNNDNNIMSCKNQIRTQNCATAMRNSDNRTNYIIISGT